MKQYHSYYTSIKQLAKRNKLTKKYSGSIDRSILWRWKNEDEDKYLGAELSNIDLLVNGIVNPQKKIPADR